MGLIPLRIISIRFDSFRPDTFMARLSKSKIGRYWKHVQSTRLHMSALASTHVPGPGKHLRLCQDDHRHTLLSESRDLQLGLAQGIPWDSLGFELRDIKV